jgi:hypothetical protein
MHINSVQSMEYTITNPLLSAALLAAVSPTVPTGMVQWLFACLFVSHLLCMPILYLCHIIVKYNKDHYMYFHSKCMYTGLVLLLLSCIILQANAFAIKFIYVTGSWDYYTVDGLLQGSVWLLFVMQMVFLFTVILVALLSMVGNPNNMQMVSSWSSNTYTCINLLIKIGVGVMVAVSAINQKFPVFSCDVWEGLYASPNPPVVL